MRLFLGGDPGAFTTIYLRHARHVAGVVTRLLCANDCVDDIVQETFVVAHEDLRKLREGAALRGWLVAIAVNRARRHLGSLGRRALLDRIRRAGEVASDNAKPVDPRLDGIQGALERLSVRLRVPLLLVRVEEMTYGEAAEALGVSVATVKRRVAAAEERLRRIMHAER